MSTNFTCPYCGELLNLNYIYIDEIGEFNCPYCDKIVDLLD
jgi:uncharacterized Zn-finger protein